MKKDFFLFNQRFVFENELPEDARGEFEKLAVGQVDAVGVQRINKLIADIKDEDVKKKALEFITQSILGEEGVGRSLKSFDRKGAKEEENIIDTAEFEQYQQYLDKAVAQITSGKIDKLTARFNENPEMLRAAIEIVVYCPEIEGLFDKNIPLEVIRARAKLIEKLKGARKHTPRSEHQNSIDTVIDGLAKLDSGDLKNKQTATFIEKFEGNSVNRAWTRDTVSYAELASRVTHDSELVSRAFAQAAPKSSAEINQDDQKKIERLRTFAASFEYAKNDAEFKTPLINIHMMLNGGNVGGAVEGLQILVNDIDDSIDVSVLRDSSVALAAALRKLGDTEGAGKQIREEAQKDIESAPQHFKFAVEEKMKKLQGEAHKHAEQKYAQVFGSLEGTLEGEDFRRLDRDEVIIHLAAAYSLEKAVDGYIKDNGSEQLPHILQQYDDMKGLYGALNWSDEGERMARETAVMVASFIGTTILTAGLGSGALLTGLAGRALALARVSSAARVIGVGKLGVGLAKGGEAIAKGSAALGAMKSVKLGKFALDAAAFSAVQHGLEQALPNEQTALRTSFMEKFGSNALMFAAFGGVGKISGALVKSLGLSEAAFVSIPGLKKLGIESAGDLTAMYALHVLETEKFSMSASEFAQMGITAIAFRVGMKTFEKAFPKLAKMAEADYKKQYGKLEQTQLGKQIAKLEKEQGRLEGKRDKYYKAGESGNEKLIKANARLLDIERELVKLREKAAAGLPKPAEPAPAEAATSTVEPAVEAAPTTAKEAAPKPADAAKQMRKDIKELKAQLKREEKILKNRKPGSKNYDRLKKRMEKNRQKLRDMEAQLKQAAVAKPAEARETSKSAEPVAAEAAPGSKELELDAMLAKYKAAHRDLADAEMVLKRAKDELRSNPTNAELKSKIDTAKAKLNSAQAARDYAEGEYFWKKSEGVAPETVRAEYREAFEEYVKAELKLRQIQDLNVGGQALKEANEGFNKAWDRYYIKAKLALREADLAAEVAPKAEPAAVPPKATKPIIIERGPTFGPKETAGLGEPPPLPEAAAGAKKPPEIAKLDAREAKLQRELDEINKIQREHGYNTPTEVTKKWVEVTDKLDAIQKEKAARTKYESARVEHINAQKEAASARFRSESDPANTALEAEAKTAADNLFKMGIEKSNAKMEYDLARSKRAPEKTRKQFEEATQEFAKARHELHQQRQEAKIRSEKGEKNPKLDKKLRDAESRFEKASRKRREAMRKLDQAAPPEGSVVKPDVATAKLRDLWKNKDIKGLKEATGKITRDIVHNPTTKAAGIAIAAGVLVFLATGCESGNEKENEEIKKTEQEFKESLPPDIALAAAAEAARLAAAAAARGEAAEEEEDEPAEGAPPGGAAGEGEVAAEEGVAAAGGAGAEKAPEAAGRSPEQKVNGTEHFLSDKTDVTLVRVADALGIKFDGDSKTAPQKIVEAIRDNLQKPLNEALKGEKGFRRLVPDGEIGPKTHAAILQLKDKNDYTSDQSALGKLISALRATPAVTPEAVAPANLAEIRLVDLQQNIIETPTALPIHSLRILDSMNREALQPKIIDGAQEYAVAAIGSDIRVNPYTTLPEDMVVKVLGTTENTSDGSARTFVKIETAAGQQYNIPLSEIRATNAMLGKIENADAAFNQERKRINGLRNQGSYEYDKATLTDELAGNNISISNVEKGKFYTSLPGYSQVSFKTKNCTDKKPYIDVAIPKPITVEVINKFTDVENNYVVRFANGRMGAVTISDAQKIKKGVLPS